MRTHDYSLLPPPVAGPLERPQLPDGAVLTSSDILADFRHLLEADREMPQPPDPLDDGGTAGPSPKPSPDTAEATDPDDTRVQW